jgi:hypothetical protein
MNAFNMAAAWRLGFRVVAEHWLAIGAILIGLGIAAPFALQYALLGEPVGLVNQSVYGVSLTDTTLLKKPLVLLAMALGYALQTWSYFASLRLGLGAGRSPVGALLFGLAAGLLAAPVIAGTHVLAELGGRALFEPEMAILSVLVFLLPLGFVFVLFYLTQVVMVAAGVMLTMALGMIYGAATGEVGLAATMAGGIGGIAVLLLVLGGVLVWLAARLSCVTPLMADRNSLNPIAAIRESWRLTMDDQGVITLYLALVGIVMALLVVGGSIALGGNGSAILRDQAGPGFGPLSAWPRLLLAIPFAVLTVMVPAGIYRQLTRDEISAEVFA